MQRDMIELSREFIYSMPESIFLDPELTLVDLRVYALIRSFMDCRKECWASNSWFGQKIHVDQRSVRRSITRLEEKNYIERIEYNSKRTLVIKQSKLQMDCSDNPVRGEDNPVRGGGQSCPGGEDNPVLQSIDSKDRFLSECGADSTKKSQNNQNQTQNIKNIFDDKFGGYELTFEQLYEDCVSYYGERKVTETMILKWIQNEKVENYAKKKKANSSFAQENFMNKLSEDDKMILFDYKYNHDHPKRAVHMSKQDELRGAELFKMLVNDSISPSVPYIEVPIEIAAIPLEQKQTKSVMNEHLKLMHKAISSKRYKTSKPKQSIKKPPMQDIPSPTTMSISMKEYGPLPKYKELL